MSGQNEQGVQEYHRQRAAETARALSKAAGDPDLALEVLQDEGPKKAVLEKKRGSLAPEDQVKHVDSVDSVAMMAKERLRTSGSGEEKGEGHVKR